MVSQCMVDHDWHICNDQQRQIPKSPNAWLIMIGKCIMINRKRWHGLPIQGWSWLADLLWPTETDSIVSQWMIDHDWQIYYDQQKKITWSPNSRLIMIGTFVTSRDRFHGLPMQGWSWSADLLWPTATMHILLKGIVPPH